MPDALLAHSQLGKATQRRLREWLSQKPFDKGDWFQRRLLLDGLTERQLCNLLMEPADSLKHRCPSKPSWLIELAEAFTSFPSPLQGVDGPSEIPAGSPFLPLVSPLLQRATTQVKQAARDLLRSNQAAPFDPDTISQLLFPQLSLQLDQILNRTAVLELNLCRLGNTLDGQTPEERFDSFIHRLRRQEIAINLLLEYPVLARLAVNCVRHWTESSIEFLGRLMDDWPFLKATFFRDTSPGTLNEVRGGLGDSHRRGRSVLVVRFSSGIQVVYKPKALSVDAHFLNLLEWFNQRGAPDLQAPRVLDRGSYGWTEFVSPLPCKDRAQIKRFYERLGAFLALLYMLEANDLHSENLIASGEHPMLLDFESLFHPRLATRATTYLTADSLLLNSVLRVGLLPQPHWGDDGEILDLSGLAGQDGQLSIRPIPYWENIGRDDMRLARKRLPLNVQANCPSIKGDCINPLDFSDALIDGFSSMYRLIEEHRDELLTPDGPLERFCGDEVRVICRPTQLYAMLLSESFHPDCLRDALDRERVFDRLWYNINEESLHQACTLIPHERRDLWDGDIPFFYTRTDSRNLYTSLGELIPNFFEKSGTEAVHSRIARLNKQDLDRQIWLIRSSLTTFAMTTEPGWPNYTLTRPTQILDRLKLIAAARDIGNRLYDLALLGETDASWVGISLVGGRRWALRPLATDLYAGLPGIILFLAYLDSVTKDGKYKTLAENGMRFLRRLVANQGFNINSVGAFEGWGGLIYLWTHLGILWRREAMLNEALGMAGLMAEQVETDSNLDLMSGSAGGIVTLLSLYETTRAHRALEIARDLGEHILKAAIPCPIGIGWRVGISPEHPLASFSHGNSGIAWALLKLFGHTGDKALHTTTLQALAFEKSTFAQEIGNWPDLRIKNGKPQFMTAWCHGAPGIGLSRLRMLNYLEDPDLHEDLRVSINTTLGSGFGNNHSLCHGDLGNLELILEASLLPGQETLCQEVDRLASQVLASREEYGWRCGVPLAVETPGLMNGLAGIGYGLLRLATSGQVPSVLLLDPPKDLPRYHMATDNLRLS